MKVKETNDSNLMKMRDVLTSDDIDIPEEIVAWRKWRRSDIIQYDKYIRVYWY